MREVVAEFRDIYPTLPMNANNFTMWQNNSHSFEAMTGVEETSLPMGASDHALEVKVLTATPGSSQSDA